MANQKLGVGEILGNALAIYRKNTGMFIKFALINVLYTLVLNIGTYFMERAQGAMNIDGLMESMASPEFQAAASPEALLEQLGSGGLVGSMGMMGIGILFFAIFLVLAFTLIPKNQLGLQYYIADTLAAGEGDALTLKGAYAKTRGKVAGLVVGTILLGLIVGACMIPVVIVVTVISVSAATDLANLIWIMAPAIFAIMAIVLPWFFLLAPVAAFGRKGDLLSQISWMKRGNHWQVVAVSLVTMLPGFAAGVLSLTGLNSLIVTAISAVVSLFLFGFSGAAQNLVYRKLAPPPVDDGWGLPAPQAGKE